MRVYILIGTTFINGHTWIAEVHTSKVGAERRKVMLTEAVGKYHHYRIEEYEVIE